MRALPFAGVQEGSGEEPESRYQGEEDEEEDEVGAHGADEVDEAEDAMQIMSMLFWGISEGR